MVWTQSRSGVSHAARGFSLIEVLVVVSIIGILASLAIPSYQNYIARSRISTAQSDLTALALHFENRYQRLLAYPATAYASTAALQTALNGWTPASDADDFAFSSTNASVTNYTLQAVGAGGGIAGCTVSLTRAGVKTISNCPEYSSGGDWL